MMPPQLNFSWTQTVRKLNGCLHIHLSYRVPNAQCAVVRSYPLYQNLIVTPENAKLKEKECDLVFDFSLLPKRMVVKGLYSRTEILWHCWLDCGVHHLCKPESVRIFGLSCRVPRYIELRAT